MWKSIFTIIISLLTFFYSNAQHTIKGRILDENKAPIGFATVALLNNTDSTLLHFGVAKDDGRFQIKSVKNGDYLMQISFVGMQTVYEPLVVDGEKEQDLGDKILSPETLEEVIVKAELIPIKFKSDTLEFDVKAFKTRPGAAVEELLEKLPGVEVDESGNIKAQGEEVTTVLVDGKEFFGKDPKVATKNLPAVALDKVQVFQAKTEEANFSGIDDGEREQTINLLLNEKHKKGYFGNVKAGVGTSKTYRAEAKAYHFTKTVQMAALGLANNINEFGFTHKGNNTFGQEVKGLNKSLAGGLNLSYSEGSFNRYFVSYLGNSREMDLREQTDTELFYPEGSFQQFQDLAETEKDQPHKANFGVRHNFNKKNRLIIDGNFQLNLEDKLSQSTTDSQFEALLVNQLNNQTTNNADDLDFDAKAVFISKFKEDRTQLKAKFLANSEQNKTTLNWMNAISFFDPPLEEVVDQFRTNDTEKLRLSGNVFFIQKFKKFWSFDLGADVAQKEENFVRAEGILNDTGEFDELAIPTFDVKESQIKPALSLRHATKKTQINFSFRGFFNQFDKILEGELVGQNNYAYFLPQFNLQSNYKSGRRLNVRYNATPIMPSVNQLFPVADSINKLAIFSGNIDLEPEYRHNLNAQWSLFDQFSFTSLFIRLTGTYTKNKISYSQSVNEDFIQTTSLVNVTGSHQASMNINFSTPLRKLGLDININFRETWNRGIVYINDVENINTIFSHNLSVRFENRVKNKWALGFGGSVSLTDSEFSITDFQNNVFYNTGYFGNLRFTPSKKWNFELQGDVTNYNSQSFDEAVSIPLIRASISYFFMQAEEASLTLSGFDLLNKYIGIQRISNKNLLVQKKWNVIGQYVMLTFNWRLRKK